jgi:hypothetical protein
MAAGNTYVALATQTVGSATASITFSSISGAYTDLVIVYSATTSSGANDVNIRFNSDTNSNYSTTALWGNGTSTGSSRQTSVTSAYVDYYGTPGTSAEAINIINIQNYSNATTYKTFLARASRAGSGTDATVGLWRSTAAINSVTLLLTSNTISVGSTFSLYGIAAA